MAFINYAVLILVPGFMCVLTFTFRYTVPLSRRQQVSLMGDWVGDEIGRLVTIEDEIILLLTNKVR